MYRPVGIVALLVGLSMVWLGFASISLAAGGGSLHDGNSTHAENTQTAMTDCPAHHDGHQMEDLQCKVACASFMPAVPFAGVQVEEAGLPASQPPFAYTLAFHADPLHAMPTPPLDTL